MRITELFTAKSIALDVAAPDQAAIIDRLVELQATHGNITDKEAYKKALYAREAEGSTYVDNGITVPHAKTACVTRPSLAALRLSAPVQYNAEDDGTTDLLFAIAAPEDGGLHVDMLARMMQMLMNEDFWRSSAPPRPRRSSWTPSTHRKRLSSGMRASPSSRSPRTATGCWPSPPAPTASPILTWPPKPSSRPVTSWVCP